MKKIVIALGGNALQEAGKPATAEAQLEVVDTTFSRVLQRYCVHAETSPKWLLW